MPVPSFIALEGRKLFLKAMVSQQIGFFFLPLGGAGGKAECSLLGGTSTFSPRCHGDWATGRSGSARCSMTPSTGTGALKREEGKEGESGSILILMCHGQCFQLVNFQNISHKEAIGHLHLSDLTTVLQKFGYEDCKYCSTGWWLTYSETVTRTRSILVKVSGSLCLNLSFL